MDHLRFRNKRLRHLREILQISHKKDNNSYLDFFFYQSGYFFLFILFIVFLYLWTSVFISGLRAHLFNFKNNFNLNRAIFFSFLKFYFNKTYT